MATIAWLLQQRAKAEGQRDRGTVKAINADLARLGYVETLPEAASAVMETTALAMPERAVPKRSVGRPQKIRE
jgi:hypothetical protein